jgi:N-sulfoglucosamine sulfohydrolase
MMSRINQFTFACLLLVSTTCLHAAEQPNFLIIMADDCTFNDLAIYGGKNARTPNIDRLAKEGLTFNHAYLAEAMCQPCRAELYTGRFPLSNGCAWNHSASRPHIKSMPHLLGELGYRVGIAGKVHVKPNKAFPFESVSGFDASCVRLPTQPHSVDGIGAFMKRDKPFCLVVALVEPHVPWVMGDASAYPVKSLKLPPNLADTPETRSNFAKYLAEVTYMDGQVGEILTTLKASGKEDGTLVLFTSEQGSQFPGNKWTTWDTGVHTALVVRWPGQVKSDARTDAIVQYADVLPTLLELAGAKHGKEGPLADLDGKSFAGVLKANTDQHRQFAFGIHNNLPEGPAYPTRTVSDGRFRYIVNLTPDEIYIEKHLMGVVGGSSKINPYWTSWPRDAIKDDAIYTLVKRYMRRPAEELYNTATDPYELKNLADDPEFTEIKERLAGKLQVWMKEQGDPGAAEDTQKALQAARAGRHLYYPAGK